jgi:hypothetical protein
VFLNIMNGIKLQCNSNIRAFKKVIMREIRESLSYFHLKLILTSGQVERREHKERNLRLKGRNSELGTFQIIRDTLVSTRLFCLFNLRFFISVLAFAVMFISHFKSI